MTSSPPDPYAPQPDPYVPPTVPDATLGDPAGYQAPGYPAPTYPGYPPQDYPPNPTAGYPPPAPPNYGAQPPYGYYPGQGYPIAGPSAQTNTMAILSLVFAFVFSPLGIVFGYIARKQIRQSGEGGAGLATAGLIVSYIFTALYVLLCGLWVVILVFAANAGTVN